MKAIYMTQGEKIVSALKRRPYTYGEMLALGVSTCPHKRVLEWLEGPDNPTRVRRTAHGLSFSRKWELRKPIVVRGGRELVAWKIVPMRVR